MPIIQTIIDFNIVKNVHNVPFKFFRFIFFIISFPSRLRVESRQKGRGQGARTAKRGATFRKFCGVFYEE